VKVIIEEFVGWILAFTHGKVDQFDIGSPTKAFILRFRTLGRRRYGIP